MNFIYSGTSKLHHASKLLDHLDGMKLTDRSGYSREKLNLPVIMKVIDLPDLPTDGVGVFFYFPDDGVKQIGWIPKNTNKK